MTERRVGIGYDTHRTSGARTLVLGGIHMSTIPAFDYALIYGERVVRSVANNTRADGQEFLREAAAIPVRTHVETFPLAEANEALTALKHDAIRGAGVLICGSEQQQALTDK